MNTREYIMLTLYARYAHAVSAASARHAFYRRYEATCSRAAHAGGSYTLRHERVAPMLRICRLSLRYAMMFRHDGM